MKIKKLKLINFKKYRDNEFLFNDDVNIIVGDNNSGKSSILEAIDMALNYNYRGKSLSTSILSDIINFESINEYIHSDKSIKKLPTLNIEIFIDNIPDYRGTNNSEMLDSQGISLTFTFDDELSNTYIEFIKENKDLTSIPVEFYKIDWLDFAGNRIKNINKKFNSLFIDPTKLHPTYGKNLYISNILTSTLNKDEQVVLGIQYRQLRESFNRNEKVSNINKSLDIENNISNKEMQIVADISGGSTIETNLQLALDGITLPFVGKGEQHQIQIKLALQNKSNSVNIILIEEPENHLSHMNLASLISFIENKKQEKQLFITTHSSYVMNKLSINKLCLLADRYKKLDCIDKNTVKSLRRLPGYDTLRAVLSSKIILVEGPSDELVLKRYYLDKKGRLPEEDGIDIIVVRGIGFNNYLEIVKHIGIKTKVVKDNDSNYNKNVKNLIDKFLDYNDIEFYSAIDNNSYSLEPLLIKCNSSNEAELDNYAKITLSTKTYNIYNSEVNLKNKIDFLRNWYSDEGGAGKKKVDSAMRIFESKSLIKFPDFFKDVYDYE